MFGRNLHGNVKIVNHSSETECKFLGPDNLGSFKAVSWSVDQT